MNGCLFVALAFFVTWKLSPSEHHPHRLLKEHRRTGIPAFVSSGTGTFLHHSHRAKDNSRVFENVTESEDNIQEEGARIQAASVISLPDHPVSDKVLSVLSTPFFQNRTRVPFFILYHSWKNFLG